MPSAGFMARAKSAQERHGLLVGDCVISQVEKNTDDEGREILVRKDEIWAGIAKLQSFQPYERTPEVGPTTLTVQRYTLHIEASATGIKVGHMAEIHGRLFRVGGTSDKSLQTMQRLLVDEQTGGIR